MPDMRDNQGGLRVPPTVQEGGALEIVVSGGIESVTVAFPDGVIHVPTSIDGRAELVIPPRIRGGTVILVSDNKFPNPTVVAVTVVGSQSS